MSLRKFTLTLMSLTLTYILGGSGSQAADLGHSLFFPRHFLETTALIDNITDYQDRHPGLLKVDSGFGYINDESEFYKYDIESPLKGHGIWIFKASKSSAGFYGNSLIALNNKSARVTYRYFCVDDTPVTFYLGNGQSMIGVLPGSGSAGPPAWLEKTFQLAGSAVQAKTTSVFGDESDSEPLFFALDSISVTVHGPESSMPK